MTKSLLFQLIFLFVLTQVIGLAVATNLIHSNVQTGIVSSNPEDIKNSFGLFFYILLFTVVLLIFLRFFKGKSFFKFFEIAAIFGTSIIVFNALLPSLSLMFSLLLVFARIFLAENILIKNIASMIAVAGAGSLLGVSLGIIPTIIFIIILAIYDVIAVFGTKHMVTLAKAISSQNLSFTYSLFGEDHIFQLGTGDIVIPLLFSASVLKKNLTLMPLNQALFLPIIILIVSLIGLILTLYYCDKKRIALPALPLQTVLMLLIFFAFNL